MSKMKAPQQIGGRHHRTAVPDSIEISRGIHGLLLQITSDPQNILQLYAVRGPSMLQASS